MVKNQIIKSVVFDESRDDDALNKALVECDRAIWYRDKNKPQSFIVALIQNERVLRYATDGNWGFTRRSMYEPERIEVVDTTLAQRLQSVVHQAG